MASCVEMKEGDIYKCETCGLELKVIKACHCMVGQKFACSVPLQCCDKDMVRQKGVGGRQ